jgi:hypothetical protein
VKEPTPTDRQRQALHALNCAIACMVAWPPGPEHLGGAVYFAALALHRLAQGDPEGRAAAWAAKYLEEARCSGTITVPGKEEPCSTEST